jgi:hypothetical protein
MRDANLWPRFLWLDGQDIPSNPAEPNLNYAHWGVNYVPRGDYAIKADEPNNLVPPEFCVVANYSQQYDNLWGWSDQNCDDRHISICRIAPPPPPSPSPPPPGPPPPSPPLQTMYISNATRTTYYFNTRLRNYWDAEAFCTSLRGSLATWCVVLLTVWHTGALHHTLQQGLSSASARH